MVEYSTFGVWRALLMTISVSAATGREKITRVLRGTGRIGTGDQHAAATCVPWEAGRTVVQRRVGIIIGM